MQGGRIPVREESVGPAGLEGRGTKKAQAAKAGLDSGAENKVSSQPKQVTEGVPKPRDTKKVHQLKRGFPGTTANPSID